MQKITETPETGCENRGKQASDKVEKEHCSSAAIISGRIVCGVYGTGVITSLHSGLTASPTGFTLSAVTFRKPK